MGIINGYNVSVITVLSYSNAKGFEYDFFSPKKA